MNTRGTLPRWDEAAMHARTRILIRLIGIIYIMIWLALLVWILGFAPIDVTVRPDTAGPDLNLALAPVLVLAALNELIVARVFDLLEGSWRSLVAYFGYGMRRLKAAQTEVAVMRRTLQEASAVYYNLLVAHSEQIRQMLDNTRVSGMVEPPIPISDSDAADTLERAASTRISAALGRMQEAESRLDKAELKLENFTDATSYQRVKRLWVAMLGLLLGVMWAGLGSLRLFSSLGVEVPARLDVILTGLIIGSIQSPVHSIVGSIQEIKDAVVGRVSSANESKSGEDSN